MSKYQKIQFTFLLSLLSLVLSACGGGEDGSSADSTANSAATTNQSESAAVEPSQNRVLHKASGRYVSIENDGVLKVWSEDLKVMLDEIKVSSSALSSLVIAPDSKKLIVGDEDGVIHFYRMENGDILGDSYKEFSVVDSGSVKDLSFDLLSYNFFSVTKDGQRRTWDRNVGIPVKEVAVKESTGSTAIPPPSAPN